MTASGERPAAPATFYAVPELAASYDAEFAGRPDLPFYVRLARRLGARRVADVGAGTGLLCSLLAGEGHEVTGVEPEETMLDIAGRQPNASRVRWVHGTAEALPSEWADLVVMTGHVAQYFLTDEAWRAVLAESRRALRPGGHVAFEIRNAALEEWRQWANAEPALAMGGTLRSEVERVGDLVTHTDHWVRGGREWTTRETLRFPSWDDVVHGLTASGLVVERTWGDWGGEPVSETSPEWIVLAGSAGD